MSSAQRANSSISAVEYPVAFWRYLILFQSWRQLESWSVTVVATAWAIHGAMYIAGLQLLPVDGLLLGIAIGSIFSVVMAMPIQFQIKSPANLSIEHIYSLLDKFHYVEMLKTNESISFRQNLPRFLRWDEGNVLVAFGPNECKITGPQSIVRRIRSSLLVANDAAK